MQIYVIYKQFAKHCIWVVHTKVIIALKFEIGEQKT